MTDSNSVFEPHRRLAAEAAERSHVPYSGEAAAVILFTLDGRWIPGVTVESASFSLTISPLLNAVTTAVALQIEAVRAAVASRPFLPHELAYARRMHLLAGLSSTTPFALGTPTAPPGERASPFVTAREVGAGSAESISGRVEADASLRAGMLDPPRAIAAARRIARRAYVSESDFPVGVLLEIDAEGYVPGVNVEHEDWMHILCAERNAIGTAISYGYRHVSSLYITCLQAAGCTPCGACRQLLAELAPTSTLWMDGDHDLPASSDPLALLPGFFAGDRLSRNT